MGRLPFHVLPADAGGGIAPHRLPGPAPRALQASTAMKQRGWNRQPGTTSVGLGTTPSMEARRAPWIQGGNRPQQSQGIGMGGIGEHGRGLAPLHDPARVHDEQILDHVPHHAQVMGDEHQGHAEVLLQLADELQDLRLDGHVQGRGRFVGDQQFGPAGKRHGDHHPLAHAAGKFEGIGLARAAPDRGCPCGRAGRWRRSWPLPGPCPGGSGWPRRSARRNA